MQTVTLYQKDKMEDKYMAIIKPFVAVRPDAKVADRVVPGSRESSLVGAGDGIEYDIVGIERIIICITEAILVSPLAICLLAIAGDN